MTSPNGRPEPAKARTNSDLQIGEGEFLRVEADIARAAFFHTLRDLRHGISKGTKNALDPSRITRAHPRAAVTTAAIAGFMAAGKLVPSKETSHPVREPAPAPAPTSDKRGGLLGTIALEIFHLLRPVLIGQLAAVIERMKHHQPESQPDSTPEPPPESPPESPPDLSVPADQPASNVEPPTAAAAVGP